MVAEVPRAVVRPPVVLVAPTSFVVASIIQPVREPMDIHGLTIAACAVVPTVLEILATIAAQVVATLTTLLRPAPLDMVEA